MPATSPPPGPIAATSTGSHATAPTAARTAGVRQALLRAAREELASVGAGAISLRAIARRAGVSHAAPKHHFGDRAGLLTALAIDGYRALSQALRLPRDRVHPGRIATTARRTPGRPPDTDPRMAELAVLGRAYVDAALAEPEIFALMFRPDLLHRDDPDLRAAQRRALAPLVTVAEPVDGDGHGTGDDHIDGQTPYQAPDLALIAWSFAHGVAMLARDGALASAAGTDRTESRALAGRLVDEFARRIRWSP